MVVDVLVVSDDDFGVVSVFPIGEGEGERASVFLSGGGGDGSLSSGSLVALIETLAGDAETLLLVSLEVWDENGSNPGLQHEKIEEI